MFAQIPRRPQLIFLILGLGIFFIVLAIFYGKNESGPETELKIATLIRQSGKVELIRAGLSQRTKVENRNELNNFDSVETFEIGEAELIFENGYHLKLYENSFATLERVNESDSYHVVVILKRGDLMVEQKGRENELYISKNGQQIDAALFNDSELHKISRPTSAEERLVVTPPQAMSLTEDEISTTMLNHKSSFFKCYARLVQKSPHITGEANLTFSIENSGRPTAINIDARMNPPTKDEDFQKCLKEVVLRLDFRPFAGPAVSTIFPLKFE